MMKDIVKRNGIEINNHKNKNNMATKKKAMGLVKIEQTSINKVKKKIIGTGVTIGDFYKEAADKELNSKRNTNGQLQ